MHVGSEEIKVRLRLREETIYRLKQEMASLKEGRDHTIIKLEERVEELMHENEQLRGYLSIKEGADGVMFLYYLLKCVLYHR